MRVEGYAFLGDFTKLCKREHLKSARVGKYGSVPIKEFVYATHLADEVIAGTNVQVVGI